MRRANKKYRENLQKRHSVRFARTDIWREGTWLDLWSVVHFLSGSSIGLGFYFLHFGKAASLVLALLSLISYEMWEVIVQLRAPQAFYLTY